MGLFNKFNTSKNKAEQISKGLLGLLEMDFNDGEFTLNKKLWNHLTSYNLSIDNDSLSLRGDIYFNKHDISQMVNEFAEKLGVDGHGEGSWEENDNENLETFGSISRHWFLDENNNGKTAEWVTDDNNNYNYSRIVRIDCDKEDNDIGVEIKFTGWSDIKEYLKM
jgi:hypothetical protein